MSQSTPFHAAPIPEPTVGRIVTYHQDDDEYFEYGRHRLSVSGATPPRTHPAIITSVWGGGKVNLTVFLDGLPPAARLGVTNIQDERPDQRGWTWPRVAAR